jgi:hypothetical protein
MIILQPVPVTHPCDPARTRKREESKKSKTRPEKGEKEYKTKEKR